MLYRRPGWSPGSNAWVRSWAIESYNERQLSKLRAVFKAYCAITYGFAHTLHPRIGELYKQEIERANHAMAQWKNEWYLRGQKKYRPVDDLPKNVLYWLGQKLESAGKIYDDYYFFYY